jgi:hypothetical protein
MSESTDRSKNVIDGNKLFTPEVIEILQKTYASAMGLLGGAYVDMPHGTKTKMSGGVEEDIPVAGIVFGADLLNAPPRLVELVFELLELINYPSEHVAEIKKILAAQQPKEAAVTFLSEV